MLKMICFTLDEKILNMIYFVICNKTHPVCFLGIFCSNSFCSDIENF